MPSCAAGAAIVAVQSCCHSHINVFVSLTRQLEGHWTQSNISSQPQSAGLIQSPPGKGQQTEGSLSGMGSWCHQKVGTPFPAHASQKKAFDFHFVLKRQVQRGFSEVSNSQCILKVSAPVRNLTPLQLNSDTCSWRVTWC